MSESYILGIETSCDETAAAVVGDGERVHSNVVSSQIATHQPYCGVVPELASREHLRAIVPVVRQALAEAGKSYESIDAIAVTQGPGTSLTYLAFNFDDPILSKREVRQALAYATDRESIVKYLLRGQARLAASLLPPNHWAYDADVATHDYDPARAERLLDAAGLPRGEDGVRCRLTLKTSTDESTRLYSEVLQAQWQKVGIALELRPQEYATFYSDVTRGSFQIYTARWVGGNNDPDFFEYVFSSKKIPPDGANRGHYRNAQLDALLDRSHVETDREKRRAILADVQRIVAEDLPYLNLWYPDNICVHRDAVRIDEIAPSGDYGFLDNLEFRSP